MNKKLILLMLILPLLLMLSIYTSTNTVTINVKVPVSKIEVAGEKVVYLNLDSNEKYKVDYTVYPITAANKKINFSFEKVGEQPLADLTFEDGYVVPKSAGVARVYLTTVDGGYKASFVVYVESTSVKQIECSIETSELMVGDTAKITTEFYPENAKNKMLTYTSSDSNIASVNNKGVVKGVGKGQATITIASYENSSIVDTVTVNVYNQDIMDLVQNQVYTYATTGSVNLLAIDTEEEFEITYKVYDTNNVLLTENVFETATITPVGGGSQYAFNYTFKDDYVGSVIVKFTITTNNSVREPLTKECVFHKVEQISASFDEGVKEVLSCYVGDWITLHDKFTVTPENVNVTYEVFDTLNYCEVVDLSENIVLKANLPGKTTIKLSVVSKNPEQVVTLEKELVVKPKYVGFTDSFGDSNIEGVWTVGKYEADGTNSVSKIKLDFGCSTNTNFDSLVTYKTNNENVTVSNNGIINISNESVNDVVEVEAVVDYKGVSLKSSEKFNVRCVGKGYNVRSFEDLYNVTNNNKVVVLHNNIVDDFGYIDSDNDGVISDESLVYTPSTVKTIESTYDTSFYDVKPTVKVLIEFKSSVYGNGYEINSHNASCMLDATGNYIEDALFKGPLDFVSMSEGGEGSSSVAKVKAQDNISFAVYKNVSLNNVKLSACKLTATDEGYNLNDLKYVGTTVEVLGDNVNINYSRISNGRTVLRVFGDIDDNTKIINLNIKNSELSNAKEFIIRMGSNCFVDGTKENPAPYLNNDTSVTFPVQKNYAENMSAAQREAYDANFIKTYVNLKNSILKNSGLFSIGIDSHFSGDALAGGIINGWQDLAKTSYGAKLTMEGDVRMYDWKDVESVDSSTLIEITGNIPAGSSFEKLKFDVKEMIKMIATDANNTGLDKIVWTDEKDNTQYVHGGIAFFGGGKNYGVAEFKDYTFEPLVGYSIGLDDVEKGLLELAAGKEEFYFLLNDSSAEYFLPTTQENMTDDLLYKK